MDPIYALHQMTSRKDMIGDSNEVKSYVMYDFYERMLSDLVISRHEL